MNVRPRNVSLLPCIKYTTTMDPSGSGGADALNYYVVDSTDCTAAASDYIMADATSSFTITFPPTPLIGDPVYVLDIAGLFNTNNVTMARNGSKINGQTEDMILDIDGEEYKFIYTNATYGWRLV